MSDPDALPAAPGAYALILMLPQARSLPVGRLGQQTFPAGIYAYLGSALGPGGLRARVGRHLRQQAGRHLRGGKPHWHIDRLLPLAQPLAVAYLLISAGLAPDPRLECAWAQALAGLPGASCPAPGFGASDCRAGCRAHLIRLPAWDAPARAALAGEVPEPIAVIALSMAGHA